MLENSYRTIKKHLASSNPEEIRQGLNLVKNEISRIGADQVRPLIEMVSTIFYIDPLDRPDLVPVLDEAINLVSGLGRSVIPVLVEQLDAGDLKAQIAVAQVLGRMGDEAIEPLLAAYESSDDSTRHAFILYALSKIKSSKIARAAYLALEAARSSDVELRDTAARAIGKFAESIPPMDLAEEVRLGFFKTLRNDLADPNVSIRAKAVRSLGKLARHGHLTSNERQTLKAACLRILGEDEKFEWDRAYAVRKEAEEALNYVRDE